MQSPGNGIIFQAIVNYSLETAILHKMGQIPTTFIVQHSTACTPSDCGSLVLYVRTLVRSCSASGGTSTRYGLLVKKSVCGMRTAEISYFFIGINASHRARSKGEPFCHLSHIRLQL
ncbi:uncharacterized protein ARMOST_21283 [Armillaria ostoyae]|uniref:Uncharacterized protein n=1 Tax=Armillaria ostoyae TaxID=47428 RepID=A0A284S9Q1_ARMOS|nr:uncharacterized protein ARMOST_21283 [Armillaria ostoyae]